MAVEETSFKTSIEANSSEFIDCRILESVPITTPSIIIKGEEALETEAAPRILILAASGWILTPVTLPWRASSACRIDFLLLLFDDP